ncbi:hypothetical protein Tco_1501351, partial [Tanacetum coccineum]
MAFQPITNPRIASVVWKLMGCGVLLWGSFGEEGESD